MHYSSLLCVLCVGLSVCVVKLPCTACENYVTEVLVRSAARRPSYRPHCKLLVLQTYLVKEVMLVAHVVKCSL